MSKSPLSSRVIRQSLDSFYKANVLWAVYGICTYGALYTGMLLSLGMSQAQIGLIMAVPMVTLPVQIIGAVLQQRYFNRKRFWVTALSFFILMFALMVLLIAIWPVLPPTAAVPLFAGVLILSYIGFQLHRPVQLAWQTDIVPDRDVSMFWNRLTAQGMVASVAAGFVMGWIADKLGRDNRLTFVYIFGFSLIFAAMSLRMNSRVPDPDPDPGAEEGILVSIMTVLKNSNFRRLSAIFSIQSMSAWLFAAFIFVHLQRVMGFTMVQMQILAGVSCTVSFASGRLFGIVGKHYGRKPVLLICTLVKSVEIFLWGIMRPGDHWLDLAVRQATTSLVGEWATLPTGFASVIPVFILAGFVNVGIASMQLAFMRNIGTRHNQTLAISLFLSLSGVVGGVSAAMSGWFFNLLATPGFGPDSLRRLAGGFGLTPFNILALASAVGYATCAFFIRFLREDGAAPTMHVVRMLLANNPVRGVYHAQSLGNSLTEATRMNILSHARGGLVESELVRGLYSCSSQVRDGAMRNLASMGAEMETAVAEELVKLLAMPELGLQIEAAKALGRSRYKPALPQLTAFFDNEDANLAVASIYAVGLIGDKSVLRDLRRILELEDTLPVAKAQAAESLSRLCDPSDARLIFSAFTQNTNPVLLTQSLVSICRCMEDGPHVYKVFEAEFRNPGTLTVSLFESIAQRWQGLDIDTMVDSLDGGRFHEVATSAISPALEFCLPCVRSPDILPTPFLQSQFLENGSFKDDRLEGGDYVATSLWLQLRLWAYLEYAEGDQDRFVLLTILFLCDRLAKRLDPKHPRTRPG